MFGVSYENTADAVYDPADSRYWQEESLNREIGRAFDLCNSCRMCFKYCTSFPLLFRSLDAVGEVANLSKQVVGEIVADCYQCKICYVKCPYTDRDRHAYNLNYPALLQRYVHVQARRQGVPFRDRVLQDVDLAGRFTRGWIARIANRMMNIPFHRSIVQAVLGIHKEKSMPDFAETSFTRWFSARKKVGESSTTSEKVVLFSTCFVNYNNPRLGKDVVAVLEKNNIEVIYPKQNCCGMPGINSGDLEWAQAKMKRNVEALLPFADLGIPILAVNPTCSLTLKQEYPAFLTEPEWREKAKRISSMVRDVGEYLFELKKKEKLNRGFQSSPGKVAYHVPCHLRAQNVGYKSRDLMRLIPGCDVTIVEECCGHDGNWAMKKEYFQKSLEAGQRSFEALTSAEADVVATDCPLAAIQLEQGASLQCRPEHPAQILAKAYLAPSEGGFEKSVSEKG